MQLGPHRKFVILLKAVLMVTSVATASELAAQPKTLVPDAQAQQTAKKAAGEVFAGGFAQAKSAAEKTALATEMMNAAAGVQAGSADQYVLLKIALDVAAGAGDAATALQAVERLLEQFDEPAAELIGDTLLTAARQATTTAQHKAVAEAALSIAGELADADQYETALRMCEAARSSAQRTKLYPLAKELTAQIEEIKRQQLLLEDYRKALSVLEDKPADPEANLAAGRHLCFGKGNWDRGVPMLALGSDAALKAAALKDLRGADSADEQAAIGDAWWDLAEAKQGAQRDTLRLRAGFWYRQAEPKLVGGLAGLKIKERLTEVDKLARGITKVSSKRPMPQVAAPPSSARPALPWEVTILRASYGLDNRQVDVTDLLRRTYAKDPFAPMQADGRAMRDPAPGSKKRLALAYRFNGQPQTLVLAEGIPSLLPPISPDGVRVNGAAQELTIIAARYGAGVTWRDVTELVKRSVATARAQLTWEELYATGPDPWFGIAKHLVIWFDYQGKRYAQLVHQDEPIPLPKMR